LKTEYRVYESTDGMYRRSLATDEYSVPLAVRDHIDFITPTVQFDAVISKRGAEKWAGPDIKKMVLKTEGQTASMIETEASDLIDPTDLSICDQFITTECLRALYNMPNGTLANSLIQIVEYTPQSFIPDDLSIYLSVFDPWIPLTTQPQVDLVDGAVLVDASGDNVESNLDLQLTIPLGR
jgi:tripeptidyl-peptidase I